MPITILDGIVIGVALFSAVLAMVRGFSREVLSVASWVGAAAAAYFLYPLLLPYAKDYTTACAASPSRATRRRRKNWAPTGPIRRPPKRFRQRTVEAVGRRLRQNSGERTVSHFDTVKHLPPKAAFGGNAVRAYTYRCDQGDDRQTGS